MLSAGNTLYFKTLIYNLIAQAPSCSNILMNSFYMCSQITFVDCLICAKLAIMFDRAIRVIHIVVLSQIDLLDGSIAIIANDVFTL